MLGPATFGLIRRLVGSKAQAEDLFQDAMMTFDEKLHTYRGEAPLGAWLRHALAQEGRPPGGWRRESLIVHDTLPRFGNAGNRL